MRIEEALEISFFDQRKSKVKKKFNPARLTLATLLLLISSGLADEKPEAFGICSSPYTYVRSKCNGVEDCAIDLCSYLYPICHPRLNHPQFLHSCWGFFSGCTDLLDNEIRRNRRINGNFGTEFLGKRSNNKAGGSRAPSGGDPSKPKSSPGPKFYSLPLNKFAQTKVVKRGSELEKRGDGKVVVGSEFLGKRGQEPKGGGWASSRGRMRRLTGNELLGKRSAESFDGSEFLGKRAEGFGTEFLGKRDQENPFIGSELLGKKSSRAFTYGFPGKRFAGNELLGKRYMGNEFLGKRSHDLVFREPHTEIWAEGDSELTDEPFNGYQPLFEPRIEGKDCERGSFNFESCGESKSKDTVSSERDSD